MFNEEIKTANGSSFIFLRCDQSFVRMKAVAKVLILISYVFGYYIFRYSQREHLSNLTEKVSVIYFLYGTYMCIHMYICNVATYSYLYVYTRWMKLIEFDSSSWQQFGTPCILIIAPQWLHRSCSVPTWSAKSCLWKQTWPSITIYLVCLNGA